MIWFWLGFFGFVAGLLVLDLGVLHKNQEAPSIRSAAYWTLGWMTLGLAFTGFVFLMYEHGWLGATLHERSSDGSVHPSTTPGPDAAFEYVSAYLLEYALSVDNIFVIALVFKSFKVPPKYQHRVLFWGIIGAFVFRLAMLTGGAAAAARFSWVFYIFGAYLAWQGVQLLRGKSDDDDDDPAKSRAVRILRRFVRIVDDREGKLMVRVDGYRALTTVGVCLITIELTDVVFALDSIPAVLSVSEEVFIMVTSNILAIMGLRSLYFVLVGAMAKFHYLEMALGVLLILIGVKLAMNNHYHVPNAISLALIAGIIGTGVLASVIANRRAESKADAAQD